MTHETRHPMWTLAFHWRSHRRILNVAIALRGKSTGWGSAGGHWWSGKGRPRRWFVGHSTLGAFHRGLDVTLRQVRPGASDRVWTLFKIRTGASTPKARLRGDA